MGESAGLRRARTASTERNFAAELSRITTEIKATSTFTVSSSGAPKPVPSLTPPWESMMTKLKPTLPKAARFVKRPRIRATPSASSPARMSCAKSSALGTTVPCMNARKKGGACETKPPASKLVASCCGNGGFSSFSTAPLSQTAPTSTRTHTMPFTARLLSEIPDILILRIRTTATKGGRTGAPPLAYVALYGSQVTAKGASVEERISRRRFMRLGTALGVGAAGASVLAACGGGSGGGGDAAGGSDDGGGSGGGGGYRGDAGGGGGSTESSGKKTGGGAKGAQASG